MEAWGRRVRNIFRDDIRKTKQKMESLRGKEDDELIKEYNREKKNLTKFLLQEERFRKQCSKVHWLRGGDRNIKYFHVSVKARKIIKQISSFEDEDGRKVDSQKEICALTFNYLPDLFTASVGDYDSVANKISQKDNEMLIHPFTKEEFKEVVF